MEICPQCCSSRCIQTSGHKITLTSLSLIWQETQRPSKISPAKCTHFLKLSGYNVTVAEKALIATKNEGVQPAIDW